MVVMHVKEFYIGPHNYKMQSYFMENRPNPSCLGIFSMTSWNAATCKGGLGLLLIDTNGNVCYAI